MFYFRLYSVSVALLCIAVLRMKARTKRCTLVESRIMCESAQRKFLTYLGDLGNKTYYIMDTGKWAPVYIQIPGVPWARFHPDSIILIYLVIIFAVVPFFFFSSTVFFCQSVKTDWPSLCIFFSDLVKQP